MKNLYVQTEGFVWRQSSHELWDNYAFLIFWKPESGKGQKGDMVLKSQYFVEHYRVSLMSSQHAVLKWDNCKLSNQWQRKYSFYTTNQFTDS